jgi:hypothetical protein
VPVRAKECSADGNFSAWTSPKSIDTESDPMKTEVLQKHVLPSTLNQNTIKRSHIITARKLVQPFPMTEKHNDIESEPAMPTLKHQCFTL